MKPELQYRKPKPLDFAVLGMNPNAVELWYRACHNLPDNPKQAWNIALTKYAQSCKDNKLYPFHHSEHSTLAVFYYLQKRRNHFIRFLIFTKIMRSLKVIRLVDKQVTLYPNSFELTVQVQVRIDDPTFVKSLQKYKPYRFDLMRHDQKYVAKIDPGLTIFIYNDAINNADLWHIGYSIVCPILPTAENKKEFILQLWNRLSKTIRDRSNPIRQI